MSVYSLTNGSEKALSLLLQTGGSETLLLERQTSQLRAGISIERFGAGLEAVVTFGSHVNTQTLQAEDTANQAHLAEFVEAIANGTLCTAEEPSPQPPAFTPASVVPCRHCGGEAIAYSRLRDGSQDWVHGVKCRYNDCSRVDTGATTEQAAADLWNTDHRQGVVTNHIFATSAADPLPAHPDARRFAVADMVNHPPHYNGHPSGVECIEVTERLPFSLGNAFKYVFRHRTKNGREDLQKARWYLQRELERAERGGISLGDLQAANALAGRIAAHEAYPLGACLVAIASDQPQEAMHWLDQLLAA
ncbi:MAG: DUF3310 domain-containing protein [Pseudomonas sp.]